MLVIRNSQQDVLKLTALKEFEDSRVAHIKKHFPNHYKIMGEECTRRVIRHAIDRAKDYGFTTKRNVSLYLTVMLILGSHFDREILLPWTAGILTEDSSRNSSERADLLVNKAIEYFSAVAGPNNFYLNRTLLNIRKEDFLVPSVASSDDYESAALAHLETLFPHKCAIVGNANLKNLIQAGLKRAPAYGIIGKTDMAMYTGMMFLLGTFFDIDPQFPVAETILNDPELRSPSEKLEKLRTQAMRLLETFLEKS